ncbi:MAG: rubredoxin [Pseudanabaenaceae cyanobacterium SKYGB_i_bin29]|nr:rubredoxin [Pseudanabaenaceae cyanobacterium SKYG29]MDW8422089.1 rubredoxin [Pseudanabaenaceae cyanobacterium SKYGB_i_bin29]
MADATQADHRFECLVCGYVYEPSAGDKKRGIPAGTAFADLPDDWRCPVCNTRKQQFKDIGVSGAPSGFAENLKYGLGANSLTPAQKNLLIFGALALGFLFLMSFYSVD